MQLSSQPFCHCGDYDIAMQLGECATALQRAHLCQVCLVYILIVLIFVLLWLWCRPFALAFELAHLLCFSFISCVMQASDPL